MKDLEKLSDENKQDFVKQVHLIDIKQRNEDRHLIESDNYNNYKLIVLIILGVDSAALGGTTLTSLSNAAYSPILYSGAAFLIFSIITILIELNISYRQGIKLANELAKNDGMPVNVPDNGVILYLIAQATALVSFGLLLIFMSVAIGNNENTRKLAPSSGDIIICPCSDITL